MRVSGRWDLNPRHPPWEGGVLPLNYSRTIDQIINEKSSGVKCKLGGALGGDSAHVFGIEHPISNSQSEGVENGRKYFLAWARQLSFEM